MAASRRSSNTKRKRRLSKSREAVAARARRMNAKNNGRVEVEWVGARGEGDEIHGDRPSPTRGPRGNNDHHLATDGSLRPGLNGGYAKVESSGLSDQVAELGRLVDRLEWIQPGTGLSRRAIDTEHLDRAFVAKQEGLELLTATGTVPARVGAFAEANYVASLSMRERPTQRPSVVQVMPEVRIVRVIGEPPVAATVVVWSDGSTSYALQGGDGTWKSGIRIPRPKSEVDR